MPKQSDDQHTPADTGDYSATKAPENRPHVESKVGATPAQRPGGRRGTPSDVGMSALDRRTVPALAGATAAETANDANDDEIEPGEARRKAGRTEG